MKESGLWGEACHYCPECLPLLVLESGNDSLARSSEWFGGVDIGGFRLHHLVQLLSSEDVSELPISGVRCVDECLALRRPFVGAAPRVCLERVLQHPLGILMDGLVCNPAAYLVFLFEDGVLEDVLTKFLERAPLYTRFAFMRYTAGVGSDMALKASLAPRIVVVEEETAGTIDSDVGSHTLFVGQFEREADFVCGLLLKLQMNEDLLVD